MRPMSRSHGFTPARPIGSRGGPRVPHCSAIAPASAQLAGAIPWRTPGRRKQSLHNRSGSATRTCSHLRQVGVYPWVVCTQRYTTLKPLRSEQRSYVFYSYVIRVSIYGARDIYGPEALTTVKPMYTSGSFLESRQGGCGHNDASPSKRRALVLLIHVPRRSYSWCHLLRGSGDHSQTVRLSGLIRDTMATHKRPELNSCPPPTWRWWWEILMGVVWRETRAWGGHALAGAELPGDTSLLPGGEPPLSRETPLPVAAREASQVVFA
jgi:hypothetical protein